MNRYDAKYLPRTITKHETSEFIAFCLKNGFSCLELKRKIGKDAVKFLINFASYKEREGKKEERARCSKKLMSILD